MSTCAVCLSSESNRKVLSQKQVLKQVLNQARGNCFEQSQKVELDSYL